MELRARAFESNVESVWTGGEMRHRVLVQIDDSSAASALAEEIQRMGLVP